jgi:hypothetical protein
MWINISLKKYLHKILDTTNFTIKDCEKLNGGLNKWEKNIKKWHGKYKEILIKTWNKTRPSNCPVGQYSE